MRLRDGTEPQLAESYPANGLILLVGGEEIAIVDSSVRKA